MVAFSMKQRLFFPEKTSRSFLLLKTPEWNVLGHMTFQSLQVDCNFCGLRGIKGQEMQRLWEASTTSTTFQGAARQETRKGRSNAGLGLSQDLIQNLAFEKLLCNSDNNVFCSCKDVERRQKVIHNCVLIQKGELREIK